jgi:hypothetical protein
MDSNIKTDSLLKLYEKTEKILSKRNEVNKENKNAAFLSLGLSTIGIAVAATTNFAPIMAAGVGAAFSGAIMATYFSLSNPYSREVIQADERMLDKIYKLMSEEEQDIIDNLKEQRMGNKNNSINIIDTLRKKFKSEEVPHTRLKL